MKTLQALLTTFAVILVLAVTAGITCPTDQDIYRAMRNENDLGPILGRVVVNRATVDIENDYCYKVITSRVDGSVVAYAYFGTVKLEQ